MSTAVAVNTYTHTATYIASKMMLTLKEIVRESGLNPGFLSNSWKPLEEGVAVWIRSRHLQSITLEVYSLNNVKLSARWDLEVTYAISSGTDGSFYTDTELIRKSIAKVGLKPENCGYHFLVSKADGAPVLDGWTTCAFLPTDNFVRYSVGSQIGAPGASVETSYWVSK